MEVKYVVCYNDGKMTTKHRPCVPVKHSPCDIMTLLHRPNKWLKKVSASAKFSMSKSEQATGQN